MSAGDVSLPEDARRWIEETTGGQVVHAASHHAGASRSAWNVDLESGRTRRALFLLRDKGQGGGSQRDAAVLRALHSTAIPVPKVVACSGAEANALLLLERVEGRSDFPTVDAEHERAPTARHLMALTADLHALDIEKLEIPHLSVPERPADCAHALLTPARAACKALGDAADPFFAFALGWLEAHVPESVNRYALVHSDMGPGNFLYVGGRVTAIVDWEVAHFGDPMEDLAAISVRDMATPVGSLEERFREYEAAGGGGVDLERVHYYRALVLVRNSLLIGLGLAHPSEDFNVEEMTMYQTLLQRAAALVLCDNLGVARPTADELAGQDSADDGARDTTTASDVGDLATLQATGRLHARRMLRVAEGRRALMGPLADRLPQELGAS